ncbi:hypothetical protein C7271_13640 [filamentous cyanobacterium CCP5]|nr:hypothetical protein C7271_13640 [filamentous cyanobacterium CCP5]
MLSQLREWLTSHLPQESDAWLGQAIEQISTGVAERVLFTRFSTVARRLGKADLQLSADDLQKAQALRPGWNPQDWSVDQAARTLLLLAFPSEDADLYGAAIKKLVSAADVAEQVAIYQSLPLLPHPDCFIDLAIDGLRTNITAVFNAIALQNPYPADYFDEAAWNQMVLKALFVGSELSQIQRLDQRTNAKLAKMLSDYAHERWAAGRSVNPQLWRALGPFVKETMVSDLERLLHSPEPFEQQAGALACASAADSNAQALLDTVPTLKHQIEMGQLTWKQFSLTYP